MKKIMILLLLVFALIIPFVGQKAIYASEEPEKVKVVADQTIVYKQPSITSDILIAKCEYGTVFDVISDDSIDYKLFHKVSVVGMLEDETIQFGYILKAHTLDIQVTSPTKALDDNGVIRNDNAVVYELVDNQYVQTEKTLKKDTKIRVLDGYDSSKEYTFVSFLENDILVSYYVKTADVQVFGVNYSLIVAIMTLITCACALSIVLGLKAKKKKKKKQAKA